MDARLCFLFLGPMNKAGVNLFCYNIFGVGSSVSKSMPGESLLRQSDRATESKRSRRAVKAAVKGRSWFAGEGLDRIVKVGKVL